MIIVNYLNLICIREQLLFPSKHVFRLIAYIIVYYLYFITHQYIKYTIFR